MEKPEVFFCHCYSPEHQFIFHYFEDDNELILEVHLTTYKNFFKRLWAGLKYAFGHRSRYGEFDEIVINPNDKERFLNIINKLKTNEN
jgi:hypothetical protein